MLLKKCFIIVGLTTFNKEFLRISVPAIAKLRQNIFLIVHNDNPSVTVTKKEIASLGYHGPIHLINSRANYGPMRARLNILSAIDELKVKSDWMIFVDDDDLLIDVDVPQVSLNNFAVMQNMVFIRKRLLDLLKVIENPKNYDLDNFHVAIERPHIGIVGCLMRTSIMIRLGKMIEQIIGEIYGIDASLGTRPPADAVMWLYLHMYAKHLDANAEPIYMDRTNYIATNLDTAPQKYGMNLIPNDQSAQDNEKIMQKYRKLFQELLGAAPTGL